MKYKVQRLENIHGIPTWVDTQYVSLLSARSAERGEFFRRKPSR
jgi:hypothetical protein